jgi:hypothetical protein
MKAEPRSVSTVIGDTGGSCNEERWDWQREGADIVTPKHSNRAKGAAAWDAMGRRWPTP